jgi:hypothetical protein
MTKSYLLYRCGKGRRVPVMIFTAGDADEARDAPTWLKRRHPKNKRLCLGPGEFFEVIEQGQCPPGEWDKAAAKLGGGAGRGTGEEPLI